MLPATAAGSPPSTTRSPADLSGSASPTTADRGTGWVESTLARMTLREKVGQLFMTYAYGETADTQDPAMVAANQEIYGVDNAAELIDAYHLGGVIYYNWSNNANNPEQIATLSNGVQDASLGQRVPVPALVATDQEGGIVARVGPPATETPGNMALGAGRSADDAQTAAAIMGEELRAIGVNWNFAPVADVNVNPANPVIGVRSFSEDPSLTADLTAAQVTGYSSEGVAGAAKHFPGHGDTDKDSHTGLPLINHTREQWEQIDRPPFQAAIDAGVKAIMTAHIKVPALDPSGAPATMSKPIITGILRQEMGYDGVVITDALGMGGATAEYPPTEAPVAALHAGVDMLLKPPDGQLETEYNAVLEAVRSGELSEKRINESVRRILRLKWDLGIVEDPYVDVDSVFDTVGTPDHLEAAQQLTDRTTTLVKNDDVLPLADDGSQSVFVTGWGVGTTATIAAKMEARGASTDVLETGTVPTEAEMQAAVAEAGTHDVTVVVSYRAWMDDYAAQRELVQRLTDTGKPVIAVAARDAYDIGYFPDVPAYVATYGWNGVCLESLVRVLYGEVNPTGKLPVTIPATDGSVLYPFGHGLGF
jgi:beta-N-acetylhexosaminidase